MYIYIHIYIYIYVRVYICAFAKVSCVAVCCNAFDPWHVCFVSNVLGNVRSLVIGVQYLSVYIHIRIYLYLFIYLKVFICVSKYIHAFATVSSTYPF